MNSYAQYIKNIIEQAPENTLLEASVLYSESFSSIPEFSYYKTIERLTRQGNLIHLAKGLYYRPQRSKYGIIPITEDIIIDHYTNAGQGIVIGYRLYNQKGLTTQVSKRVEVLSSLISEQRKNVSNVCVINSGFTLTDEAIPVIETMEILQNYNNIEDINKPALAAYMKDFASKYSDAETISVLEKRKYKKATIAFLASFLNYLGIKNTLSRFLSVLSSYAIPKVEEFYEFA